MVEERRTKKSILEAFLFVTGVFLVFISLLLSPFSHHYMMMGPYYLGILPSVFGILGFGLITLAIFRIAKQRGETRETRETAVAAVVKDMNVGKSRNKVNLGRTDVKLRFATKLLKEDEAKILRIIYENEGITQDSIHFRTGFSHSKISMIMKKLEEKDLIIRERFGKTYRVYPSKWVKKMLT
jgi:predicted transcriptional regulator